ncbi:uncharacterized protein [Dendrobates tinctorius]|uniref:uncharacterized protein isoform X2 n=1 Tax=Dendrobates tinctorius TaxID=92724 RepID=UPI003CCA5741
MPIHHVPSLHQVECWCLHHLCSAKIDSSLFQEIALLPYKLFGRCPRENSVLLKMDSPKSASSIPPGINTSPCRHSLRLLSNGYYICDEDSFCWDDLGNVLFSPTQCTMSYKENMVRRA